MNFTKTALTKFSLPSAGRTYIYDSKTPGLVLQVTEKGVRSFYVYRRINGRPQRHHLGRFPAMTVEQARNRTKFINGQIAEGNDPRQSRDNGRHQGTLGEMFEYWLEYHAKPYKKTALEDQKQFDRYLKHWSRRSLSSITHADVQALHAQVGKDHGRYAANRMMSLLRAMFNKTGKELGFKGVNPAKDITRFPELVRERRLVPDEMPRFFEALMAAPDPTLRDFFLVALFTGARRGNVQAMRWSELEFDRRTWLIPDTKSGKSQAVHLPNVAVEVLRRRQGSSDSEFVFPCGSRCGHLVEPKTAWARLLKRAGIADLRINDLRRTLGSWQADLGTSLPIIDKSLGLKNLRSTSIYARISLDPVRQSVDAAATEMLSAAPATTPITDP